MFLRRMVILLVLSLSCNVSFGQQTKLIDTSDNNNYLGPKTQTGIAFGLDFNNIYWGGNTPANNYGDVSFHARPFLAPGINFSIYQKIKLLKFMDLYADVGISLKFETVDYNSHALDSSGINQGAVTYTSTIDVGTVNYKQVFIPATVAFEIYPFANIDLYLLIGVRPEFLLIENSEVNHNVEIGTYKRDTATNKETSLGYTQRNGTDKVKSGTNIYRIYGFGFAVVKRKPRPIFFELSYSNSIIPYKPMPVQYRIASFEIKMKMKLLK